jgi:hypothetical protein
MPDYRIYLIGRDGHIQDRLDVVCEDEEEAMRVAKEVASGRKVELWQQARKVAEIQSEN